MKKKSNLCVYFIKLALKTVVPDPVSKITKAVGDVL